MRTAYDIAADLQQAFELEEISMRRHDRRGLIACALWEDALETEAAQLTAAGSAVCA